MFQQVHPSTFFRCFMSNSSTHTELQTKPFILLTGIDCSNSINFDQVQVLRYSNYALFTCCWDWTWNLQMIALKSISQPNTNIYCIMCPAGQFRVDFWDFKLNVFINQWDTTHYYYTLVCR